MMIAWLILVTGLVLVCIVDGVIQGRRLRQLQAQIDDLTITVARNFAERDNHPMASGGSGWE